MRPLRFHHAKQLLALFLLIAWSVAGTAASLPDFTELAAKQGPAVVNISTTQKSKRPTLPPGVEIPNLPEGPWQDLFRHFFGERGEREESQSLGSGFVIEEDGYILTNNHVVEDADEIIVRLSDRRELPAKVIGADPRSDIALIKIEADDLPLVNIGSSKELKVGEWVMAIGSPFGFDHSVSVGVVSALGRSLPSENYVPFIQTDVAINPGNSGGPLFNQDGEVIGVNSQIYSRTGGFMGLSFAIPIDVAMSVARQLKEQGYVKRGWLGVLIQDVTRDLAESFGMDTPSGALVAKVLEDSPAAKSGLQVGDVILEFNGEPVEFSSSLPPLVGSTPVDGKVPVKVMRDGRRKTLWVTIGELPAEEEIQTAEAPSRADTNRLGLSVTDLTDEQRQRLEIGSGGVLVTELGDGPARTAGIRRGDVIVKFDHRDINDAQQFERLVKELPAGKSVPVLVQRSSGPQFLALRVPE